MRFSCLAGMFRGRHYTAAVPRLGRRAFLAGMTAGAGMLAACDAVRIGGVGTRARLAISPGNQTLWRYLEAKNQELLRPKGYLVELNNVGSEDELRDGLIAGRFDAIATLLPAVPQLAETGHQVKFFLPIAWLREGYPLLVAESSPIRAVGDLAGKRVATFPLNHPGYAYWRAFLLKHYGLRGEQLSTIQNLDPQDALIGGMADAAFVSGGGWAALQAAGGYRKVADLQGEFRWLTGSDRLAIFAGFLGKTPWVDANTRFIADLTQVARQGLEAYQRDRNAFLDTVTNVPGSPPMTRDDNAAIATYLGYDAVTPDRVVLSRADVDDFAKFFPLMADAGILKASPSDAGALFKIQS
jgi:ABC-type nitrate/sulfonate/bicarbonate transport system substrate-binding protein